MRRWRKEKRCCVEVGVSLVFALLSRARAEESSACPTLAGICCHSPVPGASDGWRNCRCRCRCSAASPPRPRPAGGTHASHRTHRRPPSAHRHRLSPISILPAAQRNGVQELCARPREGPRHIRQPLANTMRTRSTMQPAAPGAALHFHYRHEVCRTGDGGPRCPGGAGALHGREAV